MADDWHRRYDEAAAVRNKLSVELAVAHTKLAEARYAFDKAESELSSIFRERIQLREGDIK